MESCIAGGGGGNVIHDFWYLGEGGMLTRNKNVFLPFLAANYESNLIYVK